MHRALAAARRLLLRFSDRDAHAALEILTEVRRLACVLSRGPDPRAVRRAEGRIYTCIQAVRAGRAGLSSKSRVLQAEEIFQRVKPVVDSMTAPASSRGRCRARIEALMGRTGDLLLLLERQLAAVSDAGALRHAAGYSALADEMRGDLEKCRLAILAEPSEAGHGTELTLLQAIGELLDSADAMACSGIRRRLRGAGRRVRR